jgi:hypothetical protein
VHATLRQPDDGLGHRVFHQIARVAVEVLAGLIVCLRHDVRDLGFDDPPLNKGLRVAIGSSLEQPGKRSSAARMGTSRNPHSLIDASWMKAMGVGFENLECRLTDPH